MLSFDASNLLCLLFFRRLSIETPVQDRASQDAPRLASAELRRSGNHIGSCQTLVPTATRHPHLRTPSLTASAPALHNAKFLSFSTSIPHIIYRMALRVSPSTRTRWRDPRSSRPPESNCGVGSNGASQRGCSAAAHCTNSDTNDVLGGVQTTPRRATMLPAVCRHDTDMRERGRRDTQRPRCSIAASNPSA